MFNKPYIEYRFFVSFNGVGVPLPCTEGYPAGTPWSEVLERNVSSMWHEVPDSPEFPRTVSWPSYAWPGGYEIHYVVKDMEALCKDCANKELPRTLDEEDDQFFIVAADVNYEDPHLCCAHCNRQILPAYPQDGDGNTPD